VPLAFSSRSKEEAIVGSCSLSRGSPFIDSNNKIVKPWRKEQTRSQSFDYTQWLTKLLHNRFIVKFASSNAHTKVSQDWARAPTAPACVNQCTKNRGSVGSSSGTRPQRATNSPHSRSLKTHNLLPSLRPHHGGVVGKNR
jgi:hypothetical protein